METKANYMLIGAFTVAGFVGILLFLMWFAKLQLNRQFAWYDIYFPEVSGLSVSSDVSFSGLSVGKVIDMELSDRGDGTVRVRVEIKEDTPVRADSTASLVLQGVTGVSNVAITAGSAGQPLLRTAASGVPVIPARGSVLQTLSDQGPEMIERLNTVTAQLTELLGEENQTRVRNILDNVERSSGNLDRAMADISAATSAIGSAAGGVSDFGDKFQGLGDAVKTTLANADTVLSKVVETADRANTLIDAGATAIGKVGDYVETDLRPLTGKLSAAMPDAAETLGSAKLAFDGAAKALNTDFNPVLTDFRNTLSSLNGAIGNVSGDLPEIMTRLRSAADSADTAFVSLRGMMDSARAPVQGFARDGLPQFTRLAVDLRSLIDNTNQLVSNLRRNPSQLLTGQRAPEFRR
ncbi:MlaD family protein [Paenirhodobacter sp.]|uniref:MlaD family protein n=1 Tax=Paenirhodobacter sp. TaxID=1965326 RepID=UPI003B3E39B9